MELSQTSLIASEQSHFNHPEPTLVNNEKPISSDGETLFLSNEEKVMVSEGENIKSSNEGKPTSSEDEKLPSFDERPIYSEGKPSDGAKLICSDDKKLLISDEKSIYPGEKSPTSADGRYSNSSDRKLTSLDEKPTSSEAKSLASGHAISIIDPPAFEENDSDWKLGRQELLVMISLMLVSFIAALDMTVLVPVLPASPPALFI